MVALPKQVCFCLLVLLIGIWVAPVQAASEDAALFQEALAPYGQWLQHNRYGLVWRPSRVEANWRPYTNGRWVLTEDGYVFETDEPWGWATYHYGNWHNTPEYGWIWIPGRTWYPHTVTWRANDEHVGWAPVPPPDAAAELSSWSGDAIGDLDYGASGYSPASLPPTSWIFTRVNDFLYGWGEPYSSRYSYYNAGLLAAPQYVPVIYERTVYIYNYVTPAYAPRACYNWGPSVTYITKVTHINQQDVHRRAQRHRLHHLHNALPPKQVMERHPAWRQLVPVAATEGQRSGRWWRPVQTRNMALNRPDALPRPASLPPRPPEAAPQVSAPGPAAVPSGQPATRPGPRFERIREVSTDGPSPTDTGGRLLRPERPPTEPPRPRMGTPAAGVTPANQPAPPVTVAPQGGDPAARVHERRPQPPTLRPQTPAPNDASNVSGRPSPAPEPARPPVAAVGRPSREAGPVVPPPDRRVQEEQQRRRFQEQEEFRQQALRRQQQEQQHRQAEMIRQQQEQQRRQADIIRQQQEQQRRQAEMVRHQQEQQRRQMEMIRQQQIQQQQRQAEMVRQQQALQQRQAEMVRQQQEQQRRQAEMQQRRQGGGQPGPPAEGQRRRPRLD